MDYTTNMQLKKPGNGDPALIGDFNANMNTLDGHQHGGGADGAKAKAVQAGVLANRPPSGTSGQLYVATDGPGLYYDNGTIWTQVQNGNAGALVKLAETLLSSDAAGIVFANIPSTYRHLRLIVQARGSTAASDVLLLLRLNNDSGANYDRQMLEGHAATVAASELLASTVARIGSIPAANAPTSAVGQVEVVLAHYAGTTFHKTLTSQWLSLIHI